LVVTVFSVAVVVKCCQFSVALRRDSLVVLTALVVVVAFSLIAQLAAVLAAMDRTALLLLLSMVAQLAPAVAASPKLR
jgi:hypothetical protein